MKNVLSIIDEVIGYPEYDNYFSRQLRDLIARKGISMIYKQQDFLSHLQTEDEIKKNFQQEAYELDESGKIKVKENNSEYPAKKTPVEEKKPETRSYHNYNIKFLMVSNFRRFPTKKDAPYGISCVDDKFKEAKTTILYGGNGCGKSSLYDALQYVFDVNNDALKYKSLHYANDKQNTIAVRAITNEGRFEVAKTAVGIKSFSMFETIPVEVHPLLGSFFCSESDITTIAVNEDISAYIYQQVGYGEANRFCEYLYSLHMQVLDSTRNVAHKEGLPETSIKEEHKRTITKLSSDIILMEEGLADTYTFIKMINDRKDRNALYDFFAKLHTTIHLTYDPNNDSVGRLTSAQKNERFEDLKAEITSVIATLKSEKQMLATRLPDYKFMLGKYDDLIKQFESISPNNDRRQHLQVKKTFFENLARFKHGELEQKLVYHIERVKRILNNPNGQDFEKDFFMQEAKDLIKASTDLERLQGREQREENLIKLSQVDGLLYSFLLKFREIMNARISAIIEPMKTTIETILQNFDMDSDEVKVYFDSQNAEMRVAYLFHDNNNDKGTVEFTPQRYLNSFRMKLYGLSVKIALSFAIMKAYNFNFPIVLDDVIYASDFNNRKGVKDFIHNLIECYQVQCKGLNELQIIFLTHDEVVFDAVCDAFPDRNEYIQGYLFDYKDVDQTDEVRIDEDKFYNLYVRK